MPLVGRTDRADDSAGETTTATTDSGDLRTRWRPRRRPTRTPRHPTRPPAAATPTSASSCCPGDSAGAQAVLAARVGAVAEAGPAGVVVRALERVRAGLAERAVEHAHLDHVGPLRDAQRLGGPARHAAHAVLVDLAL